MTDAKELLQQIKKQVNHPLFLKNNKQEKIIIQINTERYPDPDTCRKLCYLLNKDVTDFLGSLPEKLPYLKRTIEPVFFTTHGEVKGIVDWKKTERQRCRSSSAVSSLTYVCRQQKTDSTQSEENLVFAAFLKELDAVIRNINIYQIQSENWETSRYQKVQEILHKSPYFQATSSKNVTDQMLQRVKKSRNPLYRKAAELYIRYRDLPHQNSLAMPLFVPSEPWRLFEVYWVFQLLSAYAEKNADFALVFDNQQYHYHSRWEYQNRSYFLYYNTKPDHYTFFYRDDRGRCVINKVLETLFARKHPCARGRPDIILDVRNKENGKILGVLVCEVKHTPSRFYSITGLRELLEYMVIGAYKDPHDPNASVCTFMAEDAPDFSSEKQQIPLMGCLFTDMDTDLVDRKKLKKITPLVEIINYKTQSSCSVPDLINSFEAFLCSSDTVPDQM